MSLTNVAPFVSEINRLSMIMTLVAKDDFCLPKHISVLLGLSLLGSTL